MIDTAYNATLDGLPNLNISPPKRSPPRRPDIAKKEFKPTQVPSPSLGKRALTEHEFKRAYISGTLDKGAKVGNAKGPQNQEDSLVRRGLMWVQQDKLFSRWKERFIILTTGYIQIFKKGNSRISDMGMFISKVSWINMFVSH